MSNKDNGLYEFGGFRFDPFAAKLWRGDELILLSPKAAELLGLLLERQGEFVSKEEIFEKIWPETFVEDGVLTQNVYTLRKALGKTEDRTQIIENRTRLGYRITVPVASRESGADKTASTDKETSEAVNAQSPDPEIKRSKFQIAAAVIVLVVITAAGWFIYRNFHQQIASFFRKPIEQVKFRKLTNSGDVTGSAISPNGEFLAYIREQQVFLKDLRSDTEIKLNIQGAPGFTSLQFSPDGNFLYFVYNRGWGARSRIMRVPRLGGTAETVVEESRGGFSISPDDRHIAYYTAALPDPVMRLIVRNLKSGEEREIAKTWIGGGFCYDCAPAWSPDSRKLIHAEQPLGNLTLQQLFVVDAETGEKEEIKIQRLRRFEQAAWLPDGSAFFISATDTNRIFHLWKVYYPTGDVQSVTSGLSSYTKPIVSPDGKSILVQQTTDQSNIYIAEAGKLAELTPITTGNSNDFGLNSLIWVGNETILYSSQSQETGIENLWVMDATGQKRRQITDEKFSSPAVPDADSKHIYFNKINHGAPNIHRVNADGTGLMEITNETSGMRRAAQISPDGKWIYYVRRDQNGSRIVRQNTETRVEEVVVNSSDALNPGFYLKLSNDGNHLVCTNWGNLANLNSDKFTSELAVISLKDPANIKAIPVSRVSPYFGFSPDNRAIQYIDAPNEEHQLMQHGFDDPTPTSILKVGKERLFNFAWSKDGKRLALAKGESIRDAVLLTDFDN